MTWIKLKCSSIALTAMLVFSPAAVYAEQQVTASEASCEQQRLTCQKDGAQNNSFGVPVTPPDTTKQCWNNYYTCTGAGSASQEDDMNHIAAYKALCEQQRLRYGGKGASRDYPICMKSAEEWHGDIILLDKSSCASPCEVQRLTCQKNGAQTNLFGVSSTPQDKTKLCWEGYQSCLIKSCQ